ncbi:MAG: Holliday junction resolvase RuvX [Spirochaetes bacterium]|nr:Holliday junction resolvase RuvX [Spirochaetota bacterium]
MSRIMAIDYGDVRIGIALTDPLKIISSGYKTLKNCKNIFDAILDICRLKDVESIVIGIPLDQNSEIGTTAKKVLRFTKKLDNFLRENKLNIPIYEQDERYSTFEALDIMKTMKIKKKNKKNLIDQIAASAILNNFMKSSNKKKLDIDSIIV